MTLVERIPNAGFASRSSSKFLMRYFADRSDASKQKDASEAARDTHDAPAAKDTKNLSFGDHTSAHNLMRVIAESDAKAASIIGIVGARRKAGASAISRQIAGAFASFGRNALLVDASRLDFSGSPATPASGWLPSLADLATEVRPAISVVDLAALPVEAPLSAAALHEALKDAIRPGQVIIVDLPPIVEQSGLPNNALKALGAACDLVFLVCLTGTMRRNELSECVQTCKIIGLEIDGLILNDWKLPASGLLDR
jgi:Mrp family chromosome partitioning ATPase